MLNLNYICTKTTEKSLPTEASAICAPYKKGIQMKPCD